MEKLLEDAQIKVSAVLSNLHGVTGRAIMNALIAGERDPRTLAPDKGCGTDHGALAQAPVHRDLLHQPTPPIYFGLPPDRTVIMGSRIEV